MRVRPETEWWCGQLVEQRQLVDRIVRVAPWLLIPQPVHNPGDDRGDD